MRECLLLQLSAKIQTETVQLATRILRDYFVEFTKKHYTKITGKLGISEAQLKEAIAEIVRLNPRPGGQMS